MFDGTFDQLLWNVCSVGRAMRVGLKKKKKKDVIRIGCLVETNVAWSRFECDVKRQITINTRRTCLHVHAHRHTLGMCLSFEYVLFSRKE